MTADPRFAPDCRRRPDGSIDSEHFLDRARSGRNAAVASALQALLAPAAAARRLQISGARKAAARSSAASASGRRPW
jgi:hypothetical protein